jgi:integrase
MTFDQCASAYIAAHKAGWKNPKHRQQWRNTIATYASPIFGSLPVEAIDTALVTQALEPIWTSKPETASRLRGRVERILAWATVRGYRSGQNPAQLKHHLDQLLPPHKKVQRVEHHAALPYDQVPGFMRALEKQDGFAAMALRFAILTAARTNEVLGAKWNEIDFASKVWTVPPERMKGEREHRVPLPDGALSVLEAMRIVRKSDYIFPGNRRSKPLSNMCMLMLLRRMGVDVTAHGFRSSCRDWCGEETGYPREVAEAALAHVIGDKAEQAYRRQDSLEKRRGLMDDWDSYCGGGAAMVTKKGGRRRLKIPRSASVGLVLNSLPQK